MSSFKIEVEAREKRGELAIEVIHSATRILMAAGFSDDEVRELFRLASVDATEAEDDAGLEEAKEDGDKGNQDPESILYRLAEQFEQLPAVHNLRRLQKRAEVFEHDDNKPDNRQKLLSLLLEQIPVAAAAQEWLRAEAEKLRIPVVDDRQSWLSSASDEELDGEENVLFLDGYDGYHFLTLRSRDVSSLARACVLAGQPAELQAVQQALASSGVFTHLLKSELAERIRQAQLFTSFRDYVVGFRGKGEILQSELIDGFTGGSGISVEPYQIGHWLQKLASTGEIQRYKRSGRWRVTV